MKTLQKVQEENRKFIIMANNPSAETYKKALELELGFGCLLDDVYYRGDRLPCLDCVVILKYGKDNFLDTFISYGESLDMFIEPQEWDDTKIFQYKIIGKPLTLDRVLIALNGNHYGYDKSEEYPLNLMIYVKPYHEWIDWDLTKKTLENQSEETQRKFNELINEIYPSFFTTN